MPPTKNNIFKFLASDRFVLYCLLLILIFFLYLNNFYNSDEGVVLNGAWNLWNGRRLYQDFFEFIPPASFYLIFTVWKIFGVSFIATKIVAIAIFFLGLIGLDKITSRISGRRYAIFVPIVFIALASPWRIINHNVFNLTCLIWAVYFFLNGLANLKNKYFVLSGILTGIAILFLQQKGVALAVALVLSLIFLTVQKKPALYWRFIGLFSLATLAPLSILLCWPLKLISYNLAVYPFLTYAAANQMPKTLFWASLIIFLLLAFTVKILKENSASLWALLLLQLILLLTTYPLPDYFHISQICFPGLIIIFYLIDKYREKHFLAALVIGGLIFLMAGAKLWQAVRFDGGRFSSLFQTATVITTIRVNCPGMYLYSGPFLPNLYLATEKLNATPYSVLISTQLTSRQLDDALDNLIKNSPTCAVLTYSDYLTRFRHDANNRIDYYIKTHYKLIYNEGELFIYKK